MHCPNRKCKAADCPDHFFSMKSLRPDTYYRQTVTVPLCPKTDKDGKVIGLGFPTFNNDSKWFTPAFALDMDKNYTPEAQQQMLYDQQRKIRETEDSKPEVFIPKPSHRHKYCSVCKSNYEDYIEHIESSSHKKSISKSKYTKHVLELCSTLFTTQETVKIVSDDSTKEKEESDKPKITKKRKTDNKKQPEETKRGVVGCPVMFTITPEMLELYKQYSLYIPQHLNQMALNSLQYGHFPFPSPPVNSKFPNFGYPFFGPQEFNFQPQQPQVPIMINYYYEKN